MSRPKAKSLVLVKQVTSGMSLIQRLRILHYASYSPQRGTMQLDYLQTDRHANEVRIMIQLQMTVLTQVLRQTPTQNTNMRAVLWWWSEAPWLLS